MSGAWTIIAIAAVLSAVFGPWVLYFKMKDIEDDLDALRSKVDWVDEGVSALLDESPSDDDPGGLPVENQSNVIPFSKSA